MTQEPRIKQNEQFDTLTIQLSHLLDWIRWTPEPLTKNQQDVIKENA
jgi:hypothetical protein